MGKGSDGTRSKRRKAEFQTALQYTPSACEHGQGASSEPARAPLQEAMRAHPSWVVIKDGVYDAEGWSARHPGGTEVVEAWLGRDASAPFNAFHSEPKVALRYLRNLPKVGTVWRPAAAPNSPEQDLGELAEQARREGLYRANKLFYLAHFVQVVLLELGAWALIRSEPSSWPLYLAALALLATSQSQAGWLQHDFGHLSVFETRAANRLAHRVLINFFKGASAGWWSWRHSRHHSQPNIIKEDPDVDMGHIFLIGDKMPSLWASKDWGYWPERYRFQHVYWWFIGPPLLLPVYFHFHVVAYLVRMRDPVELAWTMSFFVRWGLLFAPYLGLGGMLTLYMATRFLESHWFVWVTQMNHIPMDVDFDASKGWVQLQAESTCNVPPSAFNDWFTGHLNFQIEHHLFPTMPRHNLIKVMPRVKALCKKHGLPYICRPSLTAAFAHIVASLGRSGHMWAEAYHLED